ncbi:hypothetical protein WMY93_004909 [Mugilogobius chulae]|uniref:Oxysterol-binding protein n=1 Tax=Mugilogobius chulae TaxID=88201 RepID=A0AAW0PSH5_9GOBI
MVPTRGSRLRGKRAENTSVRLKNTSVRLKNTSVRSKNTSVQSENTIVQSKNTSVQLENTGVQLENTSVQPENTSVQPENTSVQLENTSVQLENIRVQLENIRVQLENTSAQLKNTSVQLENIRVQLENTSAQLENTSVQLDNTSAQLENTSVQLDNTSAQLENTSVQLKNTSVQLKNTSVQLENTSVQLKNTSVQLENTSVQLENTSVQLKNTSVQLENIRVQLENTSVQLENTSAQLKNTSVQLENIRVQLENTSAQLENTSVQLDNTSAQLENTSVQLDNTSAQLENTSAQLENTSAQLENTSVQLKNTSVQLENTSVRPGNIRCVTRTMRNTSVRLKNTSVRLKNTSVRSKNTSVQSENTIVQSKNTSVQLENTGVQLENTSVQPENTSVQPENTSVQLENTSVQLENIRVQLENIRVQLENTSAQLKNTSVQLENIRVQLENTSVQLENTSAQLKNTSVQLENIRVQLENTSAQLENTSVQLDNTSAQLENTSVQLDNTSAQLENTSVQLDNTSAQLENTSAQLENTSAQLENTSVQLENTSVRPGNIRPSWTERDPLFLSSRPTQELRMQIFLALKLCRSKNGFSKMQSWYLILLSSRIQQRLYFLRRLRLYDESRGEEQVSPSRQPEVQDSLRLLSSALEDLSVCNQLMDKHGAALQRSLTELESVRGPSESLWGPPESLWNQLENYERIRTINERTTLFRITSSVMINACRDFLHFSQSHSRTWERVLQFELEQRKRLEDEIEHLIERHNDLERVWREKPSSSSTSPNLSLSEDRLTDQTSDDGDDTEYFDAMEDSPTFITVTSSDDGALHRTSQSDSSEASAGHSPDWSHQQNESWSCNDAPYFHTRRLHRSHIPHKPNYSLNLWSIMKNCIGKELSKIPMPVNFNEPLSMLQRLTEDLEYSELLDEAARCDSSLEQMCYVAAFSVSSYSTTAHRTAKPFNPLLGETYELDRLEEHGYRSICEQVSHHPPAAAHHVVSDRGWTLWQDITIASKFRGKYLSILPLGTIHLQFHDSGNHYVWRKVTSTVHNIIVGKLWIDQSGDIEIVNHRTKDSCQLKFYPYSYFSRDVPRKVTGLVADAVGQAHYVLSGTWDDKMESAKILQSSRGSSEGKTVYQTLSPKLLWKKYPLPENAEKMYHFSSLALTLNEPEDGVAPTDSRLRPDQRLMEEGRWDEANAQKQRLEEKQRAVRRRREAQAADAHKQGGESEGHQPLWFTQRRDSISGELSYVYQGGYWECKDKQDWRECSDIF